MLHAAPIEVPAPKGCQEFWLHLAQATVDTWEVTYALGAETIKEEVKVLQLSQKTVFLGAAGLPSAIFVRKCYEDLWTIAEYMVDQRKEAGQRVTNFRLVITGTPGIGKSIFGLYLLYQLRVTHGDDITVVWEDARAKERTLFKGRDVRIGGLDSFRKELSDSNTFYVCDGMGAVARNATTFVLCSPGAGNWKEFVKAPGTDVRYMPVWYLEELLACRAELFSNITEEKALQLYGVWGGVPREVLEKAESSGPLKLRTAVARSPTLRSALLLIGKADAPDDISSQVIHYMVAAPDNGDGKERLLKEGYTEKQVVFASQYVVKLLLEEDWQNQKQEVEEFVELFRYTPQVQGMRGQIWETLAHGLLVAGGTFKVRRLWFDGSHQRPELLNLDRMDSKTFECVPDLSTLPPGSYAVPVAKNNRGFDAVILPDSALQMTVTTDHPVSHAGLLDLCTVTGVNKLYFVVPEEIFDKMTYQQYKAVGNSHLIKHEDLKPKVKAIEQWVLTIELASARKRLKSR